MLSKEKGLLPRERGDELPVCGGMQAQLALMTPWGVAEVLEGGDLPLLVLLTFVQFLQGPRLFQALVNPCPPGLPY